MAEAKKKKEGSQDPLEKILKGDRITKKVSTHRGLFEIMFPLPTDLRRIESLIAERLEGKPITSFSEEAIAEFRVYATLDVVVVDGPEWWKDVTSLESCPDNKLIKDLYGRYLQLYRRVQAALANRESGNELGTSRPDSEDEDVGGGAFSNLTNG